MDVVLTGWLDDADRMSGTPASVHPTGLDLKSPHIGFAEGATADTDAVLRAHNIFFTERQGEFPLAEGNCHSIEDVRKSVNGGHDIDTSFTSCSACWCGALTCGIGVCCRQTVVGQGEYRFVEDELHGKYGVLNPGRHFLPCCLAVQATKKTSDLQIQNGSTSVIRVETGKFGLSHSDGRPSVLLPGLHAHNNGNWVFSQFVDSASDWSFPPLNVFTVEPGTVRSAFVSGKIKLYQAGRYFVNDTAFQLRAPISLAPMQVTFNDQVLILSSLHE